MGRTTRRRNAGPTRAAEVDATAILRAASVHHRAGRLAEAEQDYLRAAAADPQSASANYKLGVIASQTGRAETAVPYLAAALRADPDQPHHWLSLATALLGVGRFPDARAILERFLDRGFEDAESRITRTAIVANLFSEAHEHYTQSRFTKAEELIDIIVMLDSGHAEAIHIAGNIAAQTHRLDLAFNLLCIAISIDGTIAGYHANLGNVLSSQQCYEDAAACYLRAIEMDPGSAVAKSNLGVVYHKVGRLQDALDAIEAAIVLDPRYARAHVNRAVVLKEVGRLEESIACYDEALRLDGLYPVAHSNRLFAKMYSPAVTPRQMLEEAKAFGRGIADPLLRRRPFRNDPDPDRKLRIGFVSGDFREHAVNYFLEPALRGFDRTRFALVAFSNTVVEDAVTERLKTLFCGWHTICGLDEDAAADLIEAEGIDILIDLSGHTAGNRLLVFARKPAPIQVGWIGYPGTTGMAAMDYRFTDIHTEPEGLGDDLSVEALWRLPHVSACYSANPLCPEPAATMPADVNGYVTFGCFNRFTKVSDGALRAWAGILGRVPDARLLLEVANVDAPEIRTQVETRLEQNGLPLDRVILKPRIPENRYVLYNRIDVALDPFPYNGGTTSLDTLWMGVPFVALEGDHFVARMGHSILANAGLDELSARTADAYVDTACALAEDRDRLRTFRHDLRGRMMRSAHMDHPRLAADVGDAFRAMWRRWTGKAA